VSISVGGTEYPLTADDLLITMKPLEGYRVEREGSHAVALEVEIDVSLKVEGWARDIVRAVQNARQAAGLEVTDRIVLTLDGDDELVAAARAYESYVSGETLATRISYESSPDGSTAAQSREAGRRAGGMGEGAEPVMIDNRPLRIGVALAGKL
jgi:isoleucyl-tRNA synthetase